MGGCGNKNISPQPLSMDEPLPTTDDNLRRDSSDTRGQPYSRCAESPVVLSPTSGTVLEDGCACEENTPWEGGVAPTPVNPASPKVREPDNTAISLQAAAMAQTKLLGTTAPEEEWPGIRRSLKEVDSVTTRMLENGLSQVSFFIGVMNIGLTAYVVGRWPQHLWVLYVVKVLTLIPAWFVEVGRKYNGSLWVLDYCWVSNILLGLYMLANLLIGPQMGQRVQRWAFLWFFSTALGPLSWAVLALGNGLIFHSIERTATLFIHLTPALVAWTMRWSPKTLIAAWPNHFSEQSLEQASVGEIYLAGITMYLAWLVLHATWLLTCGVNAPEKGYSTVFDGLYQKHKLGAKFQKATGFKGIRAHACIYLALHAAACSVAFTWSMLCYKFWAVHTLFAIVLVSSVTWIGAGYYMHMFKSQYSKALGKLIPPSEACEC